MCERTVSTVTRRLVLIALGLSPSASRMNVALCGFELILSTGFVKLLSGYDFHARFRID